MGRGPRHAVALAVAAARGVGDGRPLHLRPARTLDRGGGFHRRHAGRPRRLARRGAAGSMSEIPRSMEATGAGAVARVAQRRRAQPSGWGGMALLIATEPPLFTCLIATYFYLRFENTEWPIGGIEKPSVTLPLVFTAMLVAPCRPLFLAAR